jgi:hypothetical protein
MHIGWNALSLVSVVALASSVGVVVLFTLGVVALGKRTVAACRDTAAVSPSVTAGLCFLGCVALVLYGLYLIVI